MSGPLSDVTIVDLTSVISGPLATGILADQGARVIKVEALTGDAMRMGGALKGGVSSLFSAMNRNKESVAVNLQSAKGVDIIKQLIADADVCVQNYRPGVVEKLGIGYRDLSAINPALVYASISGVGASGPYAGRRVYDPVIQAQAGFANAQRVDDKPDLIKMMICDKVTSLTTAQAITAALYDRKNTGKGQHVEVSMLEACLYFIWPDRMMVESFVDEPDFPGGDITGMYRTLPTRDGFITFICVQLGEFHAMCRALDRHDLVDDPRCADIPSMYANMAELFVEIVGEIAKWATDDLVKRMTEEDVPFGVVLDGDGILSDPQIEAQEILQTFDDALAGKMRLVGRNSRFSNHQTGIRAAAPTLGQHAHDVLTAAGYSADQLASFRDEGVIL